MWVGPVLQARLLSEGNRHEQNVFFDLSCSVKMNEMGISKISLQFFLSHSKKYWSIGNYHSTNGMDY